MNESAGAYKYSEEEPNTNYHIMLSPHKRAKIKRVKENPSSCPHCTGIIVYDEYHDEHYCTICGLVTKGNIEYSGLRRVYFRHGRTA